MISLDLKIEKDEDKQFCEVCGDHAMIQVYDFTDMEYKTLCEAEFIDYISEEEAKEKEVKEIAIEQTEKRLEELKDEYKEM